MSHPVARDRHEDSYHVVVACRLCRVHLVLHAVLPSDQYDHHHLLGHAWRRLLTILARDHPHGGPYLRVRPAGAESAFALVAHTFIAYGAEAATWGALPFCGPCAAEAARAEAVRPYDVLPRPTHFLGCYPAAPAAPDAPAAPARMKQSLTIR